MSFLRVLLFILISYYLLLHLGLCKAYENCLVALIKITTVFTEYVFCDSVDSALNLQISSTFQEAAAC